MQHHNIFVLRKHSSHTPQIVSSWYSSPVLSILPKPADIQEQDRQICRKETVRWLRYAENIIAWLPVRPPYGHLRLPMELVASEHKVSKQNLHALFFKTRRVGLRCKGRTLPLCVLDKRIDLFALPSGERK